MTEPPADPPLLNDAEWAVLRTLTERIIEPLGVAAEQEALDEAERRTGFDPPRLREALPSLRSRKVLVGFGEGAVQITQVGRDLLASRPLP